MPPVVVLAESRDAIRALIRDGLATFETLHPSVRWSCLGLDATPIFGNLAINFDTHASSSSVLAAYGTPASFSSKAIDRHGRYNNNCIDFEYPGWREFEVRAWSEAYLDRGDEPYMIVDRDGELFELGEGSGDERYNELVFPFLLGILKSEIPHILRTSRCRDVVCRVGVQMCDSECVEFEIV